MLVISSREGQGINQHLVASLGHRISLAIHPLLLPVLVTELATERSRFMISHSKREIEDVEHKTSHNAYREQRTVKLDDSQLPGLRLDSIRVMCKCGLHRTRTNMRLLCLSQVEEILDSAQNPPQTLSQRYREATASLRNLVRYLTNKNKVLLQQADLVQQLSETQLAMVGSPFSSLRIPTVLRG